MRTFLRLGSFFISFFLENLPRKMVKRVLPKKKMKVVWGGSGGLWEVKKMMKIEEKEERTKSFIELKLFC